MPPWRRLLELRGERQQRCLATGPSRELDGKREAVVALEERERDRRLAAGVEDRRERGEVARAVERVERVRGVRVERADRRGALGKRRRQQRVVAVEEHDEAAHPRLELVPGGSGSGRRQLARLLPERPAERLHVGGARRRESRRKRRVLSADRHARAEVGAEQRSNLLVLPWRGHLLDAVPEAFKQRRGTTRCFGKEGSDGRARKGRRERERDP